MDTASNAALDWAWRHGKPAGLGSDTLPGSTFYGVPLRTSTNTIGVLALRPENGRPLSADREHFLSSLASQSTVAIERATLVNDITQARLQTETERLRSSLLSSISHDLRTPLVAIMGATTGLREYWDRFDDNARRDLFATIEDEADRLNRFVQNLLDMTQLVSGGLKLKPQPVGVQDLIGTALHRLKKTIGKRPLRLDIPDDLPLVECDQVVMERVFVNIIDNACKYASIDQPLAITARQQEREITISIADRGPGIPEDERKRVFDMFYRVKIGSSPARGAGLGLAICRGFIEAHGGTIAAEQGSEGIGTQIIIRLPLVQAKAK
jgi:two-component system sensor histidine kinase KdpD